MNTTDPVTLEVIANRLDSIVGEMANITVRTARSSVVASGRDFSCALFDHNAQLLTIGMSLPPHILPMLMGLERLLSFYDDVAPGDIFIGNDPTDGGTHLNDVLIVTPLFRNDILLGYAANRAHWADIGGSVPGSVTGTATEIYQEGLRIPPLRLGRGEPDDGLMRFIMMNVRVPEDSRADLLGQLASCRVAEQRLVELVDAYGLDVIRSTCDEILDAGERRMRGRIAALPDGVASHEAYLDNDGTATERIRLRATVTVSGDELEVDFTGTAQQGPGVVNTWEAVSRGFAFMGVKSALDPKGPINSGVLRPISVITPKGSRVNAEAPAAFGGIGEMGQLCIVTMVALSSLVPDQVSAEDATGTNHQNYSGVAPGRGRFVYYDALSTGGGARSQKDGMDFVRTLRSGNFTMMSIEVLENRFPLVYERQQFRENSGGAGEFRGGLGLDREYRVLNDGLINILGDNAFVPPAGLAGGHRGGPNRWEIRRGDTVMPVSEIYRSKGIHPLEAGDVIHVMTPGGGGWGFPEDRDPEMVRADVIDEKISVEHAFEAYGVVLDPASYEVDPIATSKRRADMRESRIMTKLVKGGQLTEANGMRVAWVAPTSSFLSGSVVEVFVSHRLQPLTLTVATDHTVADGTLHLDEQAWADLELHEDTPRALVREVAV